MLHVAYIIKIYLISPDYLRSFIYHRRTVVLLDKGFRRALLSHEVICDLSVRDKLTRERGSLILLGSGPLIPTQNLTRYGS